MKLSEKMEQEIAYKERDSIKIGDKRVMHCIDADEKYCYFLSKDGKKVTCGQPFDRIKNRPMKPVTEGETIELQCCGIYISSDIYGPCVHYDFSSEQLFDIIRIPGHIAQSLEDPDIIDWSDVL